MKPVGSLIGMIDRSGQTVLKWSIKKYLILFRGSQRGLDQRYHMTIVGWMGINDVLFTM